MTPEEQRLINAILAFDIDGEPCELTFEQRLAREQGWDLDFARRVIAEYRRFIVLMVFAGHPVTPSEDVDEAWHLHLTYTRSYWDRLCGSVVGKPLHHNPTKGGEAEARKFWIQYEQTLHAYERVFGEAPPRDIWPPAKIRFGPNRPAAILGSALRQILFIIAGVIMIGFGFYRMFATAAESWNEALIAAGAVILLIGLGAKVHWGGDGCGGGCGADCGGCGGCGD